MASIWRRPAAIEDTACVGPRGIAEDERAFLRAHAQAVQIGGHSTTETVPALPAEASALDAFADGCFRPAQVYSLPPAIGQQLSQGCHYRKPFIVTSLGIAVDPNPASRGIVILGLRGFRFWLAQCHEGIYGDGDGNWSGREQFQELLNFF
jgi:hypothetical protein